MNNDFVVEIANQAIKVALMLSAPMLLGALFMGILISIFQAITQINEQTLSFIPKILVIVGVLAFLSPWMSDIMINFTKELIIDIPRIVNER